MSGTVYALALSGTTVYAGGAFTSANTGTTTSATRNYAAAFDATTGTVVSGWDANVNGNGVNNSPVVNALLVSGSTVYLGGAFGYVGGSAASTPAGTPRNNVAAVSAATGAVTSWDANINTANSSTTVKALAMSGSTLYAGGNFAAVNSSATARNNIAAFDATGTVTSWNPNVGATSTAVVNALAISGATLYAAGTFSTVSTQSRNRLAAIDLATGSLNPWNPNANGIVSTLALSGSTVYAGGSFTVVNGASLTSTPAGITRNQLAAFDSTTGTATAWDPSMSGSAVYTLLVSGSTTFAGGGFSLANQITRNNLAAIDLATNTVTSWNPNASGQVNALAVFGSTVYAGGAFNYVNGTSTTGGTLRNRVAAFDGTAGTVVSTWDPNVNNTVSSLAVSGSGSTVYVGGTFTGVNTGTSTSATRNRLAAFSAADGTVTTWDPNLGGTIPGSGTVQVRALAISGSTIYAGGTFSAVGASGIARNNLAAFDLSSAAPTQFNPDVNNSNSSSSISVNALALSGSTVYAGGSFVYANGSPTSAPVGVARNRIAAFDAASGAVTTWDPNVSSTVSSLAVSGATIYAGGSFNGANSVNGTTTRNYVAAFDATNGTASTTWAPSLVGGAVNALFLSGSTIHIGGNFTSLNGVTPTARFVSLNAATGTILPLSLLDFSGRAEAGGNRLTWRVAGEATGTAYTVERSANGGDYAALATVPGSAATDYSYTDAAASGTMYYRLRITEARGETYSPVVAVRRGGATSGSLTLAPQPAAGTLTITSTDATLIGTTATVVDLQGRDVARFLVDGHVSLDVSRWTPGLYALRLANGEVLRIVKR